MEILALIGAVSIITMTGGLLTFLYFHVQEVIENMKLKHYQKHRFDKPPTAKCYCIDCVRHAKDGRCSKFDGWYTGDAWFCWDAEPCTPNQIKEYKKKG